jgi:hypothetical protein
VSAVHLYTTKNQPATYYRFSWGSGFVTMLNPPRRLLRCQKCNKRRWAAHCVVQTYYDGTYYWCAPGHGCKKAKP